MLRLDFTDPSALTLSYLLFPKLLRRLQFLTEQRNPAHSANPYTSTLLQLSSRQASSRMYPYSQVVTVLVLRILTPLRSLQYTTTQKSPGSQSVSRMTLQVFHCPSVRTPTQLPKAQPAVSSGVLVQMVLSVLTRTLSRLSVTTQICMLRHTSHTTQRSQAVLRFLTFVSVSHLSSQLTL
ncbi:unknown [[Eubacterium] siraeum CAG:80]|uniref:Uncharacterized protein n=1 Tax=[Eubacterium] siraeum CAG:80 TaxID=1263080 RepID=R6RVW1_9FIRM|nr:unknown [[Eubacterium] siraeum CAG:80]